MSANVETMMFHGKLPWHGLGDKIKDNDIYDIEKGIETSGLGWEVETQPLVTVAQAQKIANEKYSDWAGEHNITPNVKHRAVVRTSDAKALGVVGPLYTPLQNRAAFEWFQPFLDTKECQLHTAGSLCGGEKVWVLAQLNRANSVIAKDDEISKFILLSNSHNGTTSIRLGFTPIRVVCANTMAMAHSNGASRLLRIRHSKSVLQNLESIRDIMNLANQEFEATAEQFRFLASRQINPQDLKKYVKICLGVEQVKDEDISTRKTNLLERLITNVLSGENQVIPSIRNTWWAAYNGINEYLNHEQGRNTNNRMNNIWFGSGVRNNEIALSEAVKLAS